MMKHIPITGSLQFDRVMRLRKWGEEHISTSSEVDFDFSGVEKCDSSALALLIAWKRCAKRSEVKIQFSNLPPALVSLATMCNIQSLYG